MLNSICRLARRAYAPRAVLDWRRLRLRQAVAMTREEKKAFMDSRWSPQEYLIPENEQPVVKPSLECKTEAVDGIAYEQSLEGLHKFMHDRFDGKLSLADLSMVRETAADSSGLPFDRQVAVVVAARRTRIALARWLLEAFGAKRPMADGLPRKLTRRRQVVDDCSWIAVNLPGIALVHIMDPVMHAQYFSSPQTDGSSFPN
jgi:hypothetical protein